MLLCVAVDDRLAAFRRAIADDDDLDAIEVW